MDARAELLATTPSDAVHSAALEQAWQLIVDAPATQALDMQLAFIDPATCSPQLTESRYFTRNMLALRDEALIILNLGFLTTVELQLRAMSQSVTFRQTQYLASDEELLALVRRVRDTPDRWLKRWRRMASAEQSAALIEELALVLVFFLGHEVGHLLGRHPEGAFAAFMDPNAVGLATHGAAALKLARHVEEFEAHHFGLPGFGKAADGESEVRKVLETFRAEHPDRHAQLEAYFAREEEADDWSHVILRDHLASLDPDAADRQRYLLGRGIFAVSLCSWYADFDVFATLISGTPLQSTALLYIEMMKSRQTYVAASALFGDVHRFTLLRGALAFESIFRDVWALPPEQRTMRHPGPADPTGLVGAELSAWRRRESIQRYTVLCIAMDTAVKFAYVGVSTPWMLQADQQRGTPQLFAMHFETMTQVMERLDRFA